MKKYIYILTITFLAAVLPFQIAVSMQSANYKIEKDSINFGGTDDGQSASYKLKDTMGEIGTGLSDSASYKMKAGYRQMLEDDPSLEFNITDAAVALGTLSLSTPSSDTAAMTAATNSTSGYSITVSGATLDTGTYTINAITAAAASVAGTEQFGLNLKDNTAPNVGTEASGGSGAAAAGYNTANNFKFVTGDTVASAAGATDTTTYTMSYIANIATTTEPGSYTATHTYICTGNF